MIAALLGSDLGEEISARMLQSIVWVHPVVLALVWAQEIVHCTRLPAGEIDRGTIDVLFGFPVSRRAVYVCDSLVWLAAGMLLLAAGFLGHWVAAQTMPEDMRPALARVLLVLLNFYGVFVAVGGVAYLTSSLCSRQGRAVAVVFAIVLSSFLLSFLAQFWEPAEKVDFLSVLHFYQPAEVLRSGVLPTCDLVVLFAFGIITWALGGEILARRSICTV
jgi:ABC-2 type transport system permease protein